MEIPISEDLDLVEATQTGKTITKPNLLLVEGPDDQYFFEALIHHLGLEDIQVLAVGGKSRMGPRLRALHITPGFADVISLGVVRDADTDPLAAFKSVSDALEAANLAAPSCCLTAAGDSPRVTVMIMPKEGCPGMLEDLCLSAVEHDAAMACVRDYFDCLSERNTCLPDNLSKARIQAFLASRPEAGLLLGQAAWKNYWNWDCSAFAQVRAFLQGMSAG